MYRLIGSDLMGRTHAEIVEYVAGEFSIAGRKAKPQIQAMVEDILNMAERSPCPPGLESQLTEVLSSKTTDTLGELRAVFWKRYRSYNAPLFDEHVYQRILRSVRDRES